MLTRTSGIQPWTPRNTLGWEGRPRRRIQCFIVLDECLLVQGGNHRHRIRKKLLKIEPKWIGWLKIVRGQTLCQGIPNVLLERKASRVELWKRLFDFTKNVALEKYLNTCKFESVEVYKFKAHYSYFLVLVLRERRTVLLCLDWKNIVYGVRWTLF